MAKLEVFSAAIDAGQAWLAVVGVVATVISLFPYLKLAAPTVLSSPATDAARQRRRPGRALTTALLVAGAATVVVGVAAAEPFLSLADQAVAMGAS